MGNKLLKALSESKPCHQCILCIDIDASTRNTTSQTQLPNKASAPTRVISTRISVAMIFYFCDWREVGVQVNNSWIYKIDGEMHSNGDFGQLQLWSFWNSIFSFSYGIFILNPSPLTPMMHFFQSHLAILPCDVVAQENPAPKTQGLTGRNWH